MCLFNVYYLFLSCATRKNCALYTVVLNDWNLQKSQYYAQIFMITKTHFKLQQNITQCRRETSKQLILTQGD